jgi:N-acetylmuramoyl-L-alanine amidase
MTRELAKAAVTHLILHCSDSPWGDERVISDWHKERGFDSWDGDKPGTFCGYHFVILNGFRTYRDRKDGHAESLVDGLVESARPRCWWGCHCLGFNQRSLGICLIGTNAFTPKQFLAARALVATLQEEYNIPLANVLGHCETPMTTKSCPNFSMPNFRASLAQKDLPYAIHL